MALLILGTASTIIYQIHYESDSVTIRTVAAFVSVGLIFLSFGLNLMIRQVKRGFFVIGLGLICSFASIGLFLFTYPAKWVYPTINYVLITYIIGLLLLMGNAFGNVTVWLIRMNVPMVESSKSKKQVYEYTDAEIEKDIENAVQKSLEKAADELQFNLIDTRPLKVGNASFGSETVVKVRDDMKESYRLEQTQNPGEREEWGATGIDKASDLLANALSEKPAAKKSRFSWSSLFHKNH